MKKHYATWRIAFGHLIIVGAISYLTSLLVVSILTFAEIELEQWSVRLIAEAVWLSSVWFGVMYSARFLAKRVVIPDANKLVNLSTVFRVILTLFSIGLTTFTYFYDPVSGIEMSSLVITTVSGVIGVGIFYVASKKYIKENSRDSEETRN